MSIDLESRIREKAERSLNRGIFEFSDFVNFARREEIERVAKGVKISYFGEEYGVERTLVRFGDPEELGYEEGFPVKIVKIVCGGRKFASPITHRDALGAVLGLGIDRGKVGDILISGSEAFVFVRDEVADFIVSELKSVSRNAATASITDGVPLEFVRKTERRKFSVASNRADAIISRLFNLSREQSSALFKNGLATINGRIVLKGERSLSDGDVVAVRGYGKFIFSEESGVSKKGKLKVVVEAFV